MRWRWTHLPIFIAGADELPKRLYEQLLGNAVGYVVRAAGCVRGTMLSSSFPPAAIRTPRASTMTRR